MYDLKDLQNQYLKALKSKIYHKSSEEALEMKIYAKDSKMQTEK
jgi:hypothetical protein